MLHFDSDYMEGAHPKVMERLLETNLEKTVGYGQDDYCMKAAEKIRQQFGCPDALVQFLVGGTQTNDTVIDALLKKYEGVLAAESGHINCHESGAVESSGHKILVLPSHDGKVWASDVEDFFISFLGDGSRDHMVYPGALYISFPTEWGTLYSLSELEELSAVCHRYCIPLFLDGARLGYGLAASDQVAMKDIARLCDVFYIGGTKVGALFGEAVVAPRPELLPHFFTLSKQHGAILAKGRLLGLQFDALFTDNLYMDISKQAVTQALRLKEAMIARGYKPYIDSPTNQQFFVLPNADIERLSGSVTFEVWAPAGQDSSIVRFVTSWNTTAEYIDKFISLLQ